MMRVKLAAMVSTGLLASVGLLSGCGSGSANVSCSPSHEFSNSYGKISAQQRGTGYGIAWGAYPSHNAAGTYKATVYLDGKKFDDKTQSYPPHGSVPASRAKTGVIFRLEGSYAGSSGSQSFWLECRAA